MTGQPCACWCHTTDSAQPSPDTDRSRTMTTSTCHPCGESFTGLTAFDKHQDVDYSRRPAVRCLDPATLGMVRNDHGRWGYPADADSRLRLAKIRAERPQGGIPGTPDDSDAAETEGSGPHGHAETA